MTYDLTPREREVVALIARGHTTRSAARVLFLSPETVRTHLQRARTRLNVRSQAQLAAIWAAEEAERLIWAQIPVRQRNWYYGRRREVQRQADLEMVVRDQRAHIANLEDQLLGMQRPDTGVQEALA